MALLTSHIALFAGRDRSILSGAKRLMAGEAEGLGLDFTDAAWLSATGRYGSAYVLDTTTPANNYNSIPGDLLTYTGTTKLTRQSDGVYRYGPHNLLTYSENATSAENSRLVITSGATPPSGYAAADKIVQYNGGTNPGYVGPTNLSLVTGAPYTFSVVAKADTTSWLRLQIANSSSSGAVWFNLSTGVRGTVNNGASSITDSGIEALGSGWYRCYVSFNASSTFAIAYLSDADAGTTATIGTGIYITGRHLRRTLSDSTYLPTTTAAKFGLPYEWGVNLTDGTNNSQTVTVRATTSAYNKTTYLVSYDGAGSVALSGGTTGAVASGAPFYLTSSTTSLVLTVTGSISNLQVREFFGVLIEPQATNLFLNSTAAASQTVTVANATTYTISFFGAGSLSYTGAATGSLSGTGASNRVSTTITTETTSLVCVVAGSINYVQIETGSVATSPIITYAASATRAADNISLATSLFSASAVNMTAFVQYNRRAGAAGGAGNVVFELSAANRADAVTQAYIGAGASNTVTVVDRGAAFAVQAAASFAATDSVDHRIALAGKTNDFAYTADGAAPVLDTAGTYQASPFTILRLGFGSGTDQLNGYLKKFMCIPRRATNSELQTMST